MTDDLWADGPDGFESVTPVSAKKTKAKVKTKGDGRHIGCPLWWFKAVYPLMRGKGELAVAMALWRLRSIQKDRTVKVSNIGLLGELGVSRWAKYRALKRLEAAGLIKIRTNNRSALEIVFLPAAREDKIVAQVHMQCR